MSIISSPKSFINILNKSGLKILPSGDGHHSYMYTVCHFNSASAPFGSREMCSKGYQWKDN